MKATTEIRAKAVILNSTSRETSQKAELLKIKKVGWKQGQKREDRIDTANALTTLWHNLYWLG